MTDHALLLDNPDGVLPQPVTKVPEGEIEIPEFYHTVKSLDQVVDVDYYIRMGGTAYGTLASTTPTGVRQRTFASVFHELAQKFGDFVEAIGEISDRGRRYTPRDILRLYERWLATGSERARQRLDELGVQLSPAAASRASH